MEVRITTLAENTASYGFLAEWGLCMLVEVDGQKVLLDTGHTTPALHNADLLGIDLGTVDTIVLSHGHADHTGGLKEILRRRRGKETRVVAHPNVWDAKYAKREGRPERYAGLPHLREELENLGARFVLSTDPVPLAEGMMTTGEVPLVTAYEAVDRDLFFKQGGRLLPDPLPDDLALVLKTELGLVVVAGCAHRGIVNTLLRAREIAGESPFHTVLGGTHLLQATPERMQRTVEDLKGLGLQRLGVSHCTGFRASGRLAAEFGDAFFMNNAGNRVTVP